VYVAGSGTSEDCLVAKAGFNYSEGNANGDCGLHLGTHVHHDVKRVKPVALIRKRTLER
jgi:hypothetical protein